MKLIILVRGYYTMWVIIDYFSMSYKKGEVRVSKYVVNIVDNEGFRIVLL